MTWTISKDFGFSASHQLDGLPANHPCSRLHGHNYTVRLTLQSDELNQVGFVVDYRDLSPFGDWLDQTFDHRHLNDVLPLINPTAENLAAWFGQWAERELVLSKYTTVWVSVSETPKTWACWQKTPFPWIG